MSDVSVDIIKNRSGEAPDLPSGANLSGVSTAATLQVTNLNPTHINASGVTTATTFSGSLKSTGTPTLGLGVTINSSGVNISGVATAGIVSATTLYGDGSNLTGVAMSIAPISYQPSVSGGDQGFTVGIGITFTERIKAGSGNVTLRLVSAGGTVVENFGVGNSVTIANNQISITPTASLASDTVYHISYPSGAFTNTAGDLSYVGTAYTFDTRSTVPSLLGWGYNEIGLLAQNDTIARSSPTQIPGTTWNAPFMQYGSSTCTFAKKTDGTMWAWGSGDNGEFMNDEGVHRSSPVQVPGTTWSTMKGISGNASVGTRTDGTLWTCGYEGFGQRGDSKTHTTSDDKYSSPVQLPGTTWGTADNKLSTAEYTVYAIKTNGTLWAWGKNTHGQLGQNESEDGGTGNYSSPVQIPGTTWSHLGTFGAGGTRAAIKTDGTLWGWGSNSRGRLAQNSTSVPTYSSPIQIPGTTWRSVYVGYEAVLATKTDGTLWAWGDNERGLCGQNNVTEYSSPTQIPGTNWSIETAQSGLEDRTVIALKTDGTAWVWGENEFGLHGLNTTHDNATYSSPVQIPGTGWNNVRCSKMDFYAVRDV